MAAKGSYLDDFAPHTHMHNLEAATNNARAAENTFDFIRGGVSGHVKIFRVTAQQQVAYTAAHQIGSKTGIFQLFDNFDGGRTNVLARDRMLVAGNYCGAIAVARNGCLGGILGAGGEEV